ncbi:MAG: pyridoxamine 5'-phosphate oxidase family protein [Bacillota bacterium]|jgi:nitroimidazol reductase NimA-like FMN-containing flavoprotein (pyridoxamine 5'-phosphate oxidase superfamily)|nr:pyridoxamine 5'-phosphate oxidase family protein [Clostridia bacterium]
MFPELRRKDRKMGEEEAREILAKGEYGVLSMVSPSGYGYGIPLSYVYLNNAIYFHCALHGYKRDILKTNNKVSFCVIGEAVTIPEKFSVKYRSVIVFGRAVEVFESERETALLALAAKYSPDYPEEGKAEIRKDGPRTCVIKIIVEHISGKAAN